MSSASKGGRFEAVFGSVVETIETLKGSKPRMVMFAAGFILIVMAVFLRSLSEVLVVAGIAIMLILVIDLARGGTVAD